MTWEIKCVERGEERNYLVDGWEPFAIFPQDVSYDFTNTITLQRETAHRTVNLIYLRRWGNGKSEATTSTPDNAIKQGIAGEEKGNLPTSNIDPVWLEETLNLIKWSGATAKSWLKVNLKVETTPEEGMLAICNRLSTKNLQAFTQKLQDLRDASGQ